MSYAKKLYLDAYLVILALYIYFNKGIAYSFLSEALLIVGLLFVIRDFKQLAIPKEKKSGLLVLFFTLAFLYIIRGKIQHYEWIDLVRDSFIFNYGLFAIIIFFFKDQIPYLLKGIYKIYKWYPIVETVLFLCLNYVPFLAELKIFGSFNLLHYKYSDMAVHLFISTLFLLNGRIILATRFFIVNAILIAYLFLVMSSYSRAGMVCFIISFILFFVFSRNIALKSQIKYYLRLFPVVILLALPFYLSTSTKANYQGRKIGLDQLNDNITSLIISNEGTTLNNNKVWRLVWWGKIIDYTFGGEYFFAGKGLGMALAQDDNIVTSESDAELRSPHNFHLNILARFGVPIFFLWCFWLYLHFKQLKKPNLSAMNLVLLCIIIMFLLNASFDVFLEGSMGAFPFWTFIGIYYMNEAFPNNNLLMDADV
jgi:hypothetical protein